MHSFLKPNQLSRVQYRHIMDFARDKPCQVRLWQICNSDPATSVMAHIPSFCNKGIGRKPHPLLVSIACSACHDAIDMRTNTDFDPEFLRLAWAEGHCRTLEMLEQEGIIKIV